MGFVCYNLLLLCGLKPCSGALISSCMDRYEDGKAIALAMSPLNDHIYYETYLGLEDWLHQSQEVNFQARDIGQ